MSETNPGGAPRWEPIARMAIRLNRDETSEPSMVATQLLAAAKGNDYLLREALAVFVAGADRGRIGYRAAESLRAAIRTAESQAKPWKGVRLRGRRKQAAIKQS